MAELQWLTCYLNTHSLAPLNSTTTARNCMQFDLEHPYSTVILELQSTFDLHNKWWS